MKKLLFITLFSAAVSLFALDINVFSSDSKTETIEFNGNSLEIKYKGKNKYPKYVIYSPDSHIMRSHYHYYMFRYKKFIKIVGNPKEIQSAKIEIKINNTKSSTDSGVKGGASPQGGFRRTYYYCTIIKVIEIKKKE
ncbi:MAG: hypothetical protein OEV44_09920 [Spirochaetota bacterium]|nr:hypothetical protein [Spirochaetota bacterium]